MDFQPNASQRAFLERAEGVAARLVREAGRFDASEDIAPWVLPALAEAQLLGVNIRPEYGGAAAGVVAYSLALRAIASACASTGVMMSVTNMVGEVVQKFGSEAQRRATIPKLCGGGLGAFALSEPGAGSDPSGMTTKAVRDGDSWVVTGNKLWITSGDSAVATVLWARTGDDGASGISCFLIDGRPEGLGVSRHEDKMGLRASHTVGLSFDELRLPKDSLLGELGQGFRIAMMALDGGRIGIASQALGIASRAQRAAVDTLKTTDGEALAARQSDAFRLADSEVDLAAAEAMALRAAYLKESESSFSREASMAKVFATEAADRICARAAELVLSRPEASDAARDTVDRCLRDVRVTRIYEGTSEIQRVVIGRHVLRSA